MKKEKWHYILGAYLKQHKLAIVMFLCFVGIFAFIFTLYDLEMEAVFYAAGICLLLSVVVLSMDFFFYQKKHRECVKILPNISLMIDELPIANTLLENDLQDMIYEMKNLLDTALTSWQSERTESVDYYTTWVHQIKTPISVIRMILESEDTREHRELLSELFRIEQYVEMVLSYLRLSSETSDYVFKEYDLDSIIKQAIHKYAPQFVYRKIRLNYSPVSIQVLTDEKWLLFIIEQVISNSIKYTQKGSVTISVTSDKILQIADTGIGIAADDIPRIFEKGFTGYNGRSDKKSTGLGLYLCKHAAERLTHKISVQSTPNTGTVVSIDLYTEKVWAN